MANIWNALINHELGEMIAGPCAVESYEQLDIIGRYLSERGIKLLRAGAYKPRTSPYSFQGLGKSGIDIIYSICKKYDMVSISEIMDVREIEYMYQFIDIFQVGSRNMFNYSLLKELGR